MATTGMFRAHSSPQMERPRSTSIASTGSAKVVSRRRPSSLQVLAASNMPDKQQLITSGSDPRGFGGSRPSFLSTAQHMNPLHRSDSPDDSEQSPSSPARLPMLSVHPMSPVLCSGDDQMGSSEPTTPRQKNTVAARGVLQTPTGHSPSQSDDCLELASNASSFSARSHHKEDHAGLTTEESSEEDNNNSGVSPPPLPMWTIPQGDWSPKGRRSKDKKKATQQQHTEPRKQEQRRHTTAFEKKALEAPRESPISPLRAPTSVTPLDSARSPVKAARAPSSHRRTTKCAQKRGLPSHRH